MFPTKLQTPHGKRFLCCIPNLTRPMGGGDHPWTIDLITVTAAAVLLIGFAAALAQHLLG
jgi:hypothetical protein